MQRLSRLVALGSLLSLTLIGCERPTSPEIPVRADATASPVVLFTDRATFLAQFPSLPLEDFEAGHVANGGLLVCPAPVDATSNNQCFLPGDIKPGLEFNSDPAGDEIDLVGAGFHSLSTSKNIVAGIFTDAFIIDFTGGNVTAAGMDLVAYLGEDVCQIDVFGQSGLLISTTAPCTNAGTFWGVSTNEAITRIRIFSPAGQAEGVDNLAFGPGAVQPVNHPPVANAGGPYSGSEGSVVLFNGSASSDPDGDPLTYDWDFGDGTLHGTGVTPSHVYADNRAGGYTVTLKVTDTGGLTGTASTSANIDNVAPTVGAITAPIAPVQSGTPVTATADFTDPGILDTHTGIIDWGDGSSANAVVTEVNGSGSASGSHVYASAGVFAVTLTVTDKDGGVGQSVFQFIVVFDPAAGFVTGGGWIASPAGAYPADPSLVGKATFGFVSRYQNGATTPSGNTEFNFQVGNLHFHSTRYDWLVVSGAKVRFKGSGTINGAGDFAFLVSAVDGALNGSADTFRMQISDKTTGIIIYDSEMGSGNGAPATTVLGGGSIVIHL